jgi:hypothetical protein
VPESATPAAPVAGAPAETATPTPTSAPAQALLDYLFGKGG